MINHSLWKRSNVLMKGNSYAVSASFFLLENNKVFFSANIQREEIINNQRTLKILNSFGSYIEIEDLRMRKDLLSQRLVQKLRTEHFCSIDFAISEETAYKVSKAKSGEEFKALYFNKGHSSFPLEYIENCS